MAALNETGKILIPADIEAEYEAESAWPPL